MKKKNKAIQIKEKSGEYVVSSAKNQYAVIIEHGEDGFFIGSVPALPGCITQAKTLPELRTRIKDAIKLCLAVAKKDPAYQNRIDRLAYQPNFIGMEMVII